MDTYHFAPRIRNRWIFSYSTHPLGSLLLLLHCIFFFFFSVVENWEKIMQGLWEVAKNLGETHEQVVPITVFVAVLCFCLVVGHLFEENRWVNESITALLIVRSHILPFFLSLHLLVMNSQWEDCNLRGLQSGEMLLACMATFFLGLGLILSNSLLGD